MDGIAYLVERVFKDHLTVSIRYTRKQVPYGCVSLLVYIFLLLWDRLWLTSACFRSRKVRVLTKLLTSLIDDRLPNMYPNTVEMTAKLFRKLSVR